MLEKEKQNIQITPINLSDLKNTYALTNELKEKIQHSIKQIFENISDIDADKIINVFTNPNQKSAFLKSLFYSTKKNREEAEQAVSFVDKFFTYFSKSLIKIKQQRELLKKQNKETISASPTIKDEIIKREIEEALVEKFTIIKDEFFNFASPENTQSELFFKSDISPLSLELSPSFIVIRSKQNETVMINVFLEDKKIYFNKKKVGTIQLRYILDVLNTIANEFKSDHLLQETR